MPSQDAELVADPVLAAAQLYPWISMASQTRVQHNSTQRTMLQAIENQAENIIGDENKFREDKIRLQAEKFLSFTDELNKCQVRPERFPINHLLMFTKTARVILVMCAILRSRMQGVRYDLSGYFVCQRLHRRLRGISSSLSYDARQNR